MRINRIGRCIRDIARMTNIICAIGFGGDASGRNKIGEIVVTVVDESFNATKTPLLRYAFPVICQQTE